MLAGLWDLKMKKCHLLKLQNQSTQPWTFFVYQAPIIWNPGIASLVWIASPLVVEVGMHATLIWNDCIDFLWSTRSQSVKGMHFLGGGHCRVNPMVGNGVLFNQNRNAPGLNQQSESVNSAALTIAVASNVPVNSYSVGTSMDGAGTMIAMANRGQTYDFTSDYWIAAAVDIEVGSILDAASVAAKLKINFPVNVRSLSYSLNEQNQWCKMIAPTIAD